MLQTQPQSNFVTGSINQNALARYSATEFIIQQQQQPRGGFAGGVQALTSPIPAQNMLARGVFTTVNSMQQSKSHSSVTGGVQALSSHPPTHSNQNQPTSGSDININPLLLSQDNFAGSNSRNQSISGIVMPGCSRNPFELNHSYNRVIQPSHTLVPSADVNMTFQSHANCTIGLEQPALMPKTSLICTSVLHKMPPPQKPKR